ncbi:MAG: hypothetical protein AB7E09_07510 [Candidatus Izemoplasmatales bacterium]
MFNKNEVIKIVENEIEELVNDFKKHPFKHRVEHSFHCELYNRLVKHEELNQYYSLIDGYTTQLIHKEWPACKLEEVDTRRGNIDLVILSDESIENSDLELFRLGDIKPFIAIEIGLNYDVKHMIKDIEKLNKVESYRSYIIHLDNKDHYNKTYEDIQQEIKKNSIGDNLKIAYISVPLKGDIGYIKHLNDSEVNPF